jgi:hypothetical protein
MGFESYFWWFRAIVRYFMNPLCSFIKDWDVIKVVRVVGRILPVAHLLLVVLQRLIIGSGYPQLDPQLHTYPIER